MRVLIAEDSPLERGMLQDAVGVLGHECLVATDGAEAWQLFCDVGADVVLLGWVHRIRDLGGVTFVDIRDRAGLSQLVIRENDALMSAAKRLRSEFVIAVSGVVQRRSEDTINPKLETGEVEVVRYSSVNDFGTVLNPLMVEGQFHGGVVQGMGQCFMESARYDADAQLLTGSFMDYAIPHFTDFPVRGTWQSHPVPAATNPLGAKGAGEGGIVSVAATIGNAVAAALVKFGAEPKELPLTPARIWALIEQGASYTLDAR